MDASRSQAYSASLTRSMIHFAPFRFDEVDLTLWRGPEPLALTRKAAHLLTCLLIARGHWVSKSDILA